jgi:hypothetical protein
MKIKIYQINQARDHLKVKFEGLMELQDIQRSHERSALIDPALYDEVYSGEVDCRDLEGVYTLFNTKHPPFHRGHSLSISDIVEVQSAPELVGRIRYYNTSELFEELDYVDSDTYNRDITEAREVGRTIQAIRLVGHHVPSVNPGFYFCESAGFTPIQFNLAQTQRPDNLLRVVGLEPGRPAYEAEISDSLRAFQQVVRGNIEVFCPFDDNAVIICNEEGKINGLPYNRTVYGEPMVGNLVIVGDDGEGNFCALTDEQIERYLAEFQTPDFSDSDEDMDEDAPVEGQGLTM